VTRKVACGAAVGRAASGFLTLEGFLRSLQPPEGGAGRSALGEADPVHQGRPLPPGPRRAEDTPPPPVIEAVAP